MKNKSIKYVIIVSVFFYLILSLCSCHKDDNPVDPCVPPTPEPDTVSRYIWTTYFTTIPMYDLYVADTNEIYIIGGLYHPVLYNGSYVYPYNLNDDNFHPYALYGYDKNNIFWGGYTIKNNTYYPAIKKVTNGNIESYVLESETGYLADVLVTGLNQAWFSNHDNNFVYYFDNGTIKKYTVGENDSTKGGRFYKNQNNEIFNFPGKKTEEINVRGYLYTYKLVNDNFQFIRKDSLNIFSPSPECLSGAIYRCGTDAIMMNESCLLHYFDGNEWLVFASDSICPFKIGGISTDSLIAFNACDYRYGIYTYGASKKWRLENGCPVFQVGGDYVHSNIQIKEGNVYFNHWSSSIKSDGIIKTGGTYLIFGKPNKNYKNSKN